jgi:hypothetical protein
VTPRVAIVKQRATNVGRLAGSLRRAGTVASLGDALAAARSETPAAENFADERIANLDESTAPLDQGERQRGRVVHGDQRQDRRDRSYKARSSDPCWK